MAEHGFALPSLVITPTGDHLQLFSKPRTSEYADAKFVNFADICMKRDLAERQFAQFVDATVAKLKDHVETTIQSAWRLVKETDAGSILFCRLMGSLGLSISPWDISDDRESAGRSGALPQPRATA
jgi:hypothetical protein